jgi:hypothetical protein
MSRTRRTYVVTAAVAAIVTAANASQCAYFSQSWGSVALALLIPTTVLLILDRSSTPGRFRVVSGRETGEVLRVVRHPDGRLDKLYWATYPVTRDPRAFGA